MRDFASAEGLGFEMKPHGAALHYRENPAKGEAAHAFAAELATAHGWATQSGKCVVELVEGQSDKGSAVRAFMQAAPFAGARPFFFGDDLTDEQGFAACAAEGGAGVLVGERPDTVAGYALPDVASVHLWLGF
jgi:trehalose 6-phosphate phosphatase